MVEENILLSVSNLGVEFDGHPILKNISFDVKRDATLAVIGPNGAGKTVLFQAILDLIPHSGKVEWAPGTRIGYVPQRLAVAKDLPLTVWEFLKFKEGDSHRVLAVLKQVGLGDDKNDGVHKGKHLLTTKMGVLSGGELQRILIAHALLKNPNVLLFDEPTSGIDVSGEETVYQLISKLKTQEDLAIVFISHELEVVYKYAENVLCLNKEKICYGPPREAVDKVALERMYGEDVHFYKHH